MTGLTPWGQLVRAWRIEHKVLLIEMAGDLGVGIDELSSYETGRRAIPKDIADKVEARMFPNGPAAHHSRKAQ